MHAGDYDSSHSHLMEAGLFFLFFCLVIFFRLFLGVGDKINRSNWHFGSILSYLCTN